MVKGGGEGSAHRLLEEWWWWWWWGGLATLGLIPIPVSNRAEHLTGN